MTQFLLIPTLFFKIAGIILPLISLWNYPTRKKVVTALILGSLAIWDGPHSVCGVCFFHSHSHFKIIPCPAQKPALTFWDRPRSVYGMYISLNKSTSYLPLCLSLNSFCDQTQRTWASESPDTRWERFYLKDSEFDSQS